MPKQLLYILFALVAFTSKAKALPYRDTDVVIQKLEFISNKNDTIKYTLEQNNPPYTIKRSGDRVTEISINIPVKIIASVKNITIPVINVYINGHKFIAKANYIYYLGVPAANDLFFPIDKQGKITFFEGYTLTFITM